MIEADLLDRTVTVVHNAAPGPTDEDEYGNPTAGAEARTPVDCYAEQQGETEDTGDRDLQEGDWLFVMPAGTAVEAEDHLVFEGKILRIIGPPRRYHEPGQGEHQVELRARYYDEDQANEEEALP